MLSDRKQPFNLFDVTTNILISDEKDISTILQPSTSSDSKYKPCYFNSPMGERQKNDNIIDGTPKNKFNFPKPKPKAKPVAQKKRKLHSAEDLTNV